jgi:hypothetical protein
MKTPEDEAFDDLAKRQGAWGGGFPAKRAMAADKINSDFDEEYKKMHEDRIKYGTSWEKDGKRIDPMSVYKEPAQDGKCKLCVDGCAACDARAQPAQEPVAWAVQGCSKMWREEFAEIDAKAEAKRIGGTCVAYALYISPPQRPWVGLTDDDKTELAKAQHSWEDLCLAVEAKLKEKNT